MGGEVYLGLVRFAKNELILLYRELPAAPPQPADQACSPSPPILLLASVDAVHTYKIQICGIPSQMF